MPAKSVRLLPFLFMRWLLGEKLLEATVELEHAGTTLHFCRCLHCTEVFEKNPERYVNRLAG